MGIISGYSDDQVKDWMQGKSADQVAQQAASMGLTAGQIQSASQLGGQNYSAADISGYAQKNGYAFGANGALANAPKALVPAPGTAAAAPGTAAPTAATPAATPATPAATPQSSPGGMYAAGTYYTQQQIRDQFAQPGFDPNQWAQQHGITNQDQIHQLATQARTIAGASNPTGEAALQNAWATYKKYNPNGAGVNDYNSFVANLDPGRADAIRAGTYSGAFNDSRDYAPGGIYYGQNISYQQAGLGSRGDGAGVPGDAWASGSTGATSTTGNGGASTTGGASGGGIIGGGSSGGSSSASGSSGPGNWQVAPNQTVQSQVADIINQNSPLMQQARARSNGAMNDRGLVNSSLAQSAGDSAVYDAALRIAQPDAATYADAAKTNANAKTSYNISQNNNQTSRDINSANIAAQRELQHSTQLYNNLASQTASANSIQSWGLNTITTIQMSDQLSAEAKNAAIASVRQYLADSYQIQGDWHTSAARAIDAIFT